LGRRWIRVCERELHQGRILRRELRGGTLITLTDHDNGTTVTAHVGDTVEVRLAENATTGYRWAAEYVDAAVVELLDTSADYPASGIGASGVTVFRVLVQGAGSGSLGFKCWRPWEGDDGVLRRFAVVITATR
jgi:inhibitor of cysteine peptidase